ncbi:MAG: glycosyltransferase [Chloroflexi bacterium CFX2]|nr:glycosyltransferase [Chloroflexi bacterium CFX2]
MRDLARRINDCFTSRLRKRGNIDRTQRLLVEQKPCSHRRASSTACSGKNAAPYPLASRPGVDHPALFDGITRRLSVEFAKDGLGQNHSCRCFRSAAIELALWALAGLKKDFPHAALVVTGPLGPHNANNIKYFEMLVDLRKRLGLEGSVHFLAELSDGFLPDEVIADFYRIADALFLPSREEGFGIPLIEAAFSHLPVFCADIPPLKKLGSGDAQFFTPDEDPARVAKMIADHFQTSMPARLAMRARVSFRWETIYREKIAPLLAEKG